MAKITCKPSQLSSKIRPQTPQNPSGAPIFGFCWFGLQVILTAQTHPGLVLLFKTSLVMFVPGFYQRKTNINTSNEFWNLWSHNDEKSRIYLENRHLSLSMTDIVFSSFFSEKSSSRHCFPTNLILKHNIIDGNTHPEHYKPDCYRFRAENLDFRWIFRIWRVGSRIWSFYWVITCKRLSVTISACQRSTLRFSQQNHPNAYFWIPDPNAYFCRPCFREVSHSITKRHLMTWSTDADRFYYL